MTFSYLRFGAGMQKPLDSIFRCTLGLVDESVFVPWNTLKRNNAQVISLKGEAKSAQLDLYWT